MKKSTTRVLLTAIIVLGMIRLVSCMEEQVDDEHNKLSLKDTVSSVDIGISKTLIYTDNAPAAIGPYSQAVLAGNTLYVSGQIAIDPMTGELTKGTISQQTVRIMDNHSAILDEAGFELSDVVKVTIYMADLSDYKEMNKVYAEYFGSIKPARETVGVAQLPMGAQVEISIIALK
jgi:2-iminobutanoate/2-iminopropanoate deaminase